MTRRMWKGDIIGKRIRGRSSKIWMENVEENSEEKDLMRINAYLLLYEFGPHVMKNRKNALNQGPELKT